jgi:hypothetical protein
MKLAAAAVLATILWAAAALPGGAATTVACEPDLTGKLVLVSSARVPVRAAALRRFAIRVPVPDLVVTDVRFTATARVRMRRVPAAAGYALRLTAPRAGPFRVRATWTQRSGRGSHVCTAAGSVRLTATAPR